MAPRWKAGDYTERPIPCNQKKLELRPLRLSLPGLRRMAPEPAPGPDVGTPEAPKASDLAVPATPVRAVLDHDSGLPEKIADAVRLRIVFSGPRGIARRQ